MSNVPIGANEDSNAPWNEKEDIFQDFDVDIVLVRREKMKLKVDKDGYLLDGEECEIKDWAKMVARNLNCEFIDYEIV
jgi:hypothetical protein